MIFFVTFGKRIKTILYLCKMKTKELPIKYKNLLTRNGVDTDKLTYRCVMTDNLLSEGIHNKDFTVIINRETKEQISITVYSFLFKTIFFNEVFDFTDKKYLDEIAIQSKKYLCNSN